MQQVRSDAEERVPMSQPWDPGALVEGLGGDVELVTEIVRTFRHECPRLVLNIRQAVEQADPAALKRAAHSLKGAVANFTTENAYRTAAELERLGQAGDIYSAAARVGALEREVDVLVSAMSRWAEERE